MLCRPDPTRNEALLTELIRTPDGPKKYRIVDSWGKKLPVRREDSTHSGTRSAGISRKIQRRVMTDLIILDRGCTQVGPVVTIQSAAPDRSWTARPGPQDRARPIQRLAHQATPHTPI